ncbi:centrosomal protein of 44 kDa [Polyodon spathula]|uniref:centrosomal protein of 44 kDa n=1 Tax=Polyodon spathula TaxID=7913 RepID=UPI001B7F5402|nr:centrosomal protein of 44 kDa [Polyodon spathula]
MATGDLKGCLRKLHQQLRSLNYDKDVDYAGLARGDPASFLPIVSHAFISYSSYLADYLVGCRVELAGKNDIRFVETVYKVLRDQFHYKPVLSKQQILQCGYAERKINILCDIISLVTKKHKELAHLDKAKVQPKKRVFASSSVQPQTQIVFPETLQPTNLKTKSFVEKHLPVSLSVNIQAPSSSVSCDSEGSDNDSCTFEEDINTEQLVQKAANEHVQLKSLEHQLAECQNKLQKLLVMEERLKAVEQEMTGKVIIDRKDWNNLVSRVVLLETELILRSRKVSLMAIFTLVFFSEWIKCYFQSGYRLDNRISKVRYTDVCTPLPQLISQWGNVTKSRSETPEINHHNSSGYSSVLSTDTSPNATNINYLVWTEVSKATTKERLTRISTMMKETEDLLKCKENPS